MLLLSFQFFFYFIYYSFCISNDFIVGKSYYFEAFAFQPFSPFLITNLLIGQLMITTIKFNNDFFRQTNKISNERPYNMLSSEVNTQLPVPKESPQNTLSGSFPLPIFLGKLL